MRTVIADLDSIDSPIKELIKTIHQPLVRISPELEQCFEETYPNFTIEILTLNRRVLNVCVEKKIIKISSLYIEILWSLGYVHFRHYQRFIDASINPDQREMDLNEHGKDYQLLKWIIEKALNQEYSPWPSDCASPIPQPDTESDLNVADEFCLGGFACLIHHELAHTQLNHEGGSTIEIEKDADIASWEWILPTGFDVTSPAGRKRLLMITHAYLIPVILDLHRGQFPSNTHPASYDRLAAALDRISTGDDHLSHSFAHSVIHLHLSIACSQAVPMYENKLHDTIKEAFDFQINHIAQFESNRRAQQGGAHQPATRR